MLDSLSVFPEAHSDLLRRLGDRYAVSEDVKDSSRNILCSAIGNMTNALTPLVSPPLRNTSFPPPALVDLYGLTSEMRLVRCPFAEACTTTCGGLLLSCAPGYEG